MDLDFSDNYKVNNKFSITDADTEYKGNLSKDDGKKILEDEKVKLRDLQEKLYADGSKSLLIVIQAMDAAGKDSLIEHVFGGVNPQGCEYLHEYGKGEWSKASSRKRCKTGI